MDAGLTNILEVIPTLEMEIYKAQPDDAKLQKHARQPPDFLQGQLRYPPIPWTNLCTKSTGLEEENLVRSTRILVFHSSGKYENV